MANIYQIPLVLATRIVKQIPISYYSGLSDLKIDVSGTADTSYFSPIERHICVALKNIQERINELGIVALPDDKKMNELIRPLVYHELLHAMKTPPYIMKVFSCNYSIRGTNDTLRSNIMNVMEDERNESNYAHTFIGVDFFANICEVTHWDPKHPNSPRSEFEMFYQIVRYHYGPINLVKLAKDICKSYVCINYTTALNEYDTRNSWIIEKYFDDIADFWEKVCDAFKLAQQASQEMDQEDGQQSGDSSNAGDSSNNAEESSDGEEGGSSPMNASESEDKGSSSSGASANGELSDEEKEAAEKALEDMKKSLQESIEAAEKEAKDSKKMAESQQIDTSGFSNIFRSAAMYKDDSWTKTLNQIFSSYHFKLGGKTGCFRSYSGDIDYKAVALRQDYKWFTRKLDAQSICKYSSAHLIMCIDVSGSFSGHEIEINKFLASISVMEKKYKEFTFDVVCLGEGEYIAPKGAREIHCEGGNDLCPEIGKILKKLHQKDTDEKIIVLYDGDACCTGYSPLRNLNGNFKRNEELGENFKYFNNSNVSIISNFDNEEYIKKFAPRAKTKLCSNYTTKFKKEVLATMRRMFSM
jgi:uncharacterized membrane protein